MDGWMDDSLPAKFLGIHSLIYIRSLFSMTEESLIYSRETSTTDQTIFCINLPGNYSIILICLMGSTFNDEKCCHSIASVIMSFVLYFQRFLTFGKMKILIVIVVTLHLVIGATKNEVRRFLTLNILLASQHLVIS